MDWIIFLQIFTIANKCLLFPLFWFKKNNSLANKLLALLILLPGAPVEPELNLKMLSDKTNIPAHYISQVINQQFGKNFSDYVNFYRVEDIKQKLIAPTQSHITIEGLAYMSGFNSKAAFQRAFKKQTGISPKEYRSQFDDSIT